jgi:hypothetical protein
MQPEAVPVVLALPLTHEGIRPMPISHAHRAALIKAEQSHDAARIVHAIMLVMGEEPETSLAEIDMVFRNAGAQTFLLAAADDSGPAFQLVRGIGTMLAQLHDAGLDFEQNRARLGDRKS